MEFRKVEDQEGLKAYASLAARVRPVHAATAEELKVGDRMIPPGVPAVRALGSRDEEDIVLVRGCQAFWYADPAVFSLDCLCPDGETHAYGEGLDWAAAWARENGARKLRLWHFSWQPWQTEHLEARGFRAGQRNPQSVARPEGFPFAEADGARAVLESQGLRFTNADEWVEERGEAGIRELYDYDMLMMRDVPLPSPWRDIPFESWRGTFEGDRRHWPWLTFVADNATIAAQTQMFRNQIHPHIALTGLTGTRREYRRRGLARALKLASMARAFGDGVQEIHTDNEESNPMLGLNLSLGFRVEHEMVEYRLDVS